MNRKMGAAASIVNICAVAGFALCMPLGFLPGCYLSSIFIAFSFVAMMCAFAAMGKKETKAAANTAMIFAGMYATVILLVYFAQLTTVRLENLNEQAKSLIDYSKFGLFFNFNLLGYCFMALSTLFAGMTIGKKTKLEKALKWLLTIHGIFAVTCFVIPMMGIFSSDMQGADWISTAILEFWCAYFIPVGALSVKYFKKA